MQRRKLLKQTALTIGAFTLSRELFAREAFKNISPEYTGSIIRLSSIGNPHGPYSRAQSGYGLVLAL